VKWFVPTANSFGCWMVLPIASDFRVPERRAYRGLRCAAGTGLGPGALCNVWRDPEPYELMSIKPGLARTRDAGVRQGALDQTLSGLMSLKCTRRDGAESCQAPLATQPGWRTQSELAANRQDCGASVNQRINTARGANSHELG
jgi:hypothetical protein